jgi:predicted P-loop ATPase
VYAASVNERGVLHDDTGSRRFAIVSITTCDPDHGVDVQQLWAQAAAMPESARFLSAEDERALLDANQEHQAADPIADLVAQRWEADTNGVSWVPLKSVLDGIDSQRNWTTQDARAVARALRNRMQVSTRTRDGYTLYAVTRRIE